MPCKFIIQFYLSSSSTIHDSQLTLTKFPDNFDEDFLFSSVFIINFSPYFKILTTWAEKLSYKWKNHAWSSVMIKYESLSVHNILITLAFLQNYLNGIFSGNLWLFLFIIVYVWRSYFFSSKHLNMCVHQRSKYLHYKLFIP